MNTNNKYYDCFSIGQMKYIRENGVEPFRVRMHHATKNTIWVFEMNEELGRILKTWADKGGLEESSYGKKIATTNQDSLFYCYSPRMRKFLGLSGLRWEKRGFNENTKSYYWTFIRSERLDELLKEYNK